MFLCVVFRCFQSFFFSHIVLIENYVHQLKGTIDQALAKRSKELICEVSYYLLGNYASYAHLHYSQDFSVERKLNGQSRHKNMCSECSIFMFLLIFVSSFASLSFVCWSLVSYKYTVITSVYCYKFNPMRMTLLVMLSALLTS